MAVPHEVRSTASQPAYASVVYTGSSPNPAGRGTHVSSVGISHHPERVGERAEAYVARGDYAGIEWHIERGGEVLSAGRAGLADPLEGVALPDVPIYRIYSMTKPLVAAVAVMLVDEGRLRLSDPVARHVPEFGDPQVREADGTTRPARTPLLVEHLFTHRSGLSYNWQQTPVSGLYAERVRFQDEHSLEDLVKSLAGVPLFADPGTVWHYSHSLDVLGHIVAVVEGKPLAAVLEERLFAPLGTTDTGYFVPESERGRILPMFTEPGDPGAGSLGYAPPPMLYPADDPDYARGGLGLFSTLPDYVKLARFLIGGRDPRGERLLSKAGVEALWTDRLAPAQTPISIAGLPKYHGYGFGLGGRVLVRPSDSPFSSVQGEAGWEGAGTTYFWLDPKNDITGVVLSQYLGQRFPLGEDIRAAFYESLDGTSAPHDG
ncbi:serine hydrolase [Microbacterium betulae]|uniref:Serine hydrolase n=1 Tax=Microbacterium betulae TaxID=2981139 RepID=A0AA97I6Q1_9MICO|nr:serine hydrolase domain-containing protein [Microbacterium sp. AB]WOF22862.1 serine hydrolase [Microbacterium sp. AB]